MRKPLRSFKEYFADARRAHLRDVLVTDDSETFELLREGKWIGGRFDRNIRIDEPTHGAGQRHAHVLARNGNELGVVNFNGTGSHGSKFKLHADDADALRARGFDIDSNNLVEWMALPSTPQLLLG